MGYTVEPLHGSDIARVQPLWHVDGGGAHPDATVMTIGLRALEPAEGPMEDVTVQGAFRSGRLVAAMKWGRRSAHAPIGDLGHLLPGDGVISWLFFDDATGAKALLARARPDLGQRIYAFPECGDMAGYTVFGTGMLSLRRQRIVRFFERQGFTIPVGEEWGPQERICFHLPIPGGEGTPSVPPGFRVEHRQCGLSSTLRLHAEDGSLIGQSVMGPARMDGRDVPRAAFLAWLFVESPYRGMRLGQTLLLMQVDCARRRGATDLYLTTHAGRPARKLYEHVGFREVDRLRSYALEPCSRAGPTANA